MPVVSFLNQKGGVGKTTLSINITRDFMLKGKKCLLVDTDPQGSALDWHEKSNGDLIDLVCLSKTTLNKDVAKLKDFYEWIFIDGIGKIDGMSISAISCSDMVLIPVQPSPVDIWSTRKIIDLVKERHELDGGKIIAAFIISQQISNTKLSKEVQAELENHNFYVLQNRTCARVAYAECFRKGQTLHDWNDPKALNEIKKISQEIEELANGIN